MTHPWASALFRLFSRIVAREKEASWERRLACPEEPLFDLFLEGVAVLECRPPAGPDPEALHNTVPAGVEDTLFDGFVAATAFELSARRPSTNLLNELLDGSSASAARWCHCIVDWTKRLTRLLESVLRRGPEKRLYKAEVLDEALWSIRYHLSDEFSLAVVETS